MTYALRSTELFAYPTSISPYTPEQQRERLNSNKSYSAEYFTDEMLGMRFNDGTAVLSVPYLQSFVHFSQPNMPDLETAAAFAQTDKALAAAKETLEEFEEMRSSYVDEMFPIGRLTFGQASSILHIGRSKLQSLADREGLPFDSSYVGRRMARHFAAADFGKLFKWHYPAGLPIEPSAY